MTLMRFGASTGLVLWLTAGFASDATAQPGSFTQTIYPGEDIQARVAAAPRGATFTLKAGVHRLHSIIPRSGDTFVGEPGTVLSGARLLTTAVRSGSYWVVADMTNENPRGTTGAANPCRASAPRCDYPEDLFIDDAPLEHVDSLAAVGPGKWYFDSRATQIFLWAAGSRTIMCMCPADTPAALGAGNCARTGAAETRSTIRRLRRRIFTPVGGTGSGDAAGVIMRPVRPSLFGDLGSAWRASTPATP